MAVCISFPPILTGCNTTIGRHQEQIFPCNPYLEDPSGSWCFEIIRGFGHSLPLSFRPVKNSWDLSFLLKE